MGRCFGWSHSACWQPPTAREREGEGLSARRPRTNHSAPIGGQPRSVSTTNAQESAVQVQVQGTGTCR